MVDFTLKVVRGPEVFRVPLEIEQPPDFKLVDTALRRLWPELGAHLARYTSGNGGIYALEEPIFADFLATMRETGPDRFVLKLEMPLHAPANSPATPVQAVDAEAARSIVEESVPSESPAPTSPEEIRYWTCPMCDEINRADRPRCNNCSLTVPPDFWITADLVQTPSAACSSPNVEHAWAPSAPPLLELEVADAHGTSSSSTAVALSAGARSMHVPFARLHKVKSEILLGKWLEKSRGITAALPEYQAAANRICISPDLMSTSRLWQHLKFLKQLKAPVPPYEEVIISIIHKAYSTKFRWVARYKTASIPGLAQGNLLQGSLQYHQALQWERPYLVQALHLLHKTEDADGLQMILGLMLSGSGWCHARKTFVFNTIVSRVRVPSAATEVPTARPGESPELQTARQALMEVVTEFIEDTKDYALKTTFLEPTKMHFRVKDEPVRENQVDVHGGNTYIAILSATLGVQLNRRPYLSDYSIGCVDFLADGAAPPLAWSDANFGRDWEGVRELRSEEVFGEDGPKPLRTPGIIDRIEFFTDTCLIQSRTGFVFKGATAREVANAAIDPKGRQDKRLHLSRYLDKFASWFSEDFILPRMISRLTGDAGRLEALQVFKDDLLAEYPALAGEEGEEDVRFWLWDMSEVPATFRTDRAAHLMRHIGVLRSVVSGAPVAVPVRPMPAIFKPGKIGLSQADGVITRIDDDGQAKCCGLRVGMHIVSIDGDTFSDALMRAKVSGEKEYTVTCLPSDDKAQDIEFEATFAPGKVGVGADWATGYITYVEEGGQALAKGVKVNMYFKLIDGEPFTVALLDKKSAGDKQYTILFKGFE